MKNFKSKKFVKYTLTLILLAVIAASAFTGCTRKEANAIQEKAVAATEAPSFTWYDFDAGFAKAKAENKHILVDFYADWCKWCVVMDEKTYTDSTVVNYINENYIAIKIDTEAEGKLNFKGKEYSYQEFTNGVGARSLPTTLFASPDGELITAYPGYIEAPNMIDILEYFRTDVWKTGVDFDKWLQDKKVNGK